MTRIIRAYVRRQAWLVDVREVRKVPRMISPFFKDHHIGIPVSKEMSRRNLMPLVHSEVPGVYHGDGLHPEKLTKPPHFLLRSCRTSTGWCKRKLETSEVLRIYEISDTVLDNSNSHNPHCAPAQTHGQIQAPREPPNKERARARLRCRKTEPNYYYCPITLVIS
jgi:hypothetical protein